MTSNSKPSISASPDGPLLVRSVENFANQNGPLETKDMLALCRCGQSSDKPFCDGTHKNIGFSSANTEERLDDRRDNYVCEAITIHDNRSICAHAGHCTDGLASVFRMNQEPWIAPDAASRDDVIATIESCPSGALSYSIDGRERDDNGGEPAIFVAPNGPYVVSGGLELVDTPLAEGASGQQITLCRCGASKNKPYCDGSHWGIEFTDDEN